MSPTREDLASGALTRSRIVVAVLVTLPVWALAVLLDRLRGRREAEGSYGFSDTL